MGLQARTKRLLVVEKGQPVEHYRGFALIAKKLPDPSWGGLKPVLVLNAGESLGWLLGITGYVLVLGKLPTSKLHDWMVELRACIPAFKSIILLKVDHERPDGVVVVTLSTEVRNGRVRGWEPGDKKQLQEMLAAHGPQAFPPDWEPSDQASREMMAAARSTLVRPVANEPLSGV